MKKKLSVIAAVIMGYTSGALAEDFTVREKIAIEVIDFSSKKLVFNGTEETSVSPQIRKRNTKYFSLDGSLAQSEEVMWAADDLHLTSYSLQNLQTGEDIKVKGTQDTFAIEYREKVDGKIKSENLKRAPNTFLGNILDEIGVKNWEKIIKGEEVVFRLLVADRFDDFRFRFYKRKVQDDEGLMILEPDSFLIRAIASEMEFHYHLKPEPFIYQYVGPAPIAINGKKEQKVQIKYRKL